jgi:hypothetical protein
MKQLRTYLLPCVTLVGSFGVLHHAPALTRHSEAEKVLIQRTFRVGEKTTYSFTEKSSTTMDMASLGGQDMTISRDKSSVCTLTISKVDPDGKSAEVELKITEQKITIDPAPPVPPSFPSDLSATAKVTSLGEWSQLGFGSSPSNNQRMIRTYFRDLSGSLRFPVEAVAPGATWKFERDEKSTASPYAKESLDVKFVGEEKFQKWDALKLEINGTIQSVFKADGTAGVDQSFEQTSSRSISYTVLVEKATGRLLKLVCKDVPYKEETKQGPMTIPSTGKYSLEISILEPKD